MIPDTFLAPGRLWLIVLLIPLVGAAWWANRRRRQGLVRFTGLDFLDELAPSRPGWRRGVVSALFLAGLLVATAGLAQPAVTGEVSQTIRGRIVVVIDTSLSMQATDVEPDRVSAAKAAAIEFVEQVAEGIEVSLISFNGLVSRDVPLTTEHDNVIRAIQDLELGPATAVGDALLAAVDTLTTATTDEVFPGAIVLLSDGATTEGEVPAVAAQAAADAGIPVFTIAFGTPDGIIEDPWTGQTLQVPVAEFELEAISQATGGTSYTAGSGDALADAYAQIQSQLEDIIDEPELQEVDITWRWLAVAVVLLALAFVTSQWWLRGVI